MKYQSYLIEERTYEDNIERLECWLLLLCESSSVVDEGAGDLRPIKLTRRVNRLFGAKTALGELVGVLPIGLLEPLREAKLARENASAAF